MLGWLLWSDKAGPEMGSQRLPTPLLLCLSAGGCPALGGWVGVLFSDSKLRNQVIPAQPFPVYLAHL